MMRTLRSFVLLAGSLCLATALNTYAAADAYEPDDSASTAQTIQNGQTQDRTIHEAGNVDWVKFVVGGGGAKELRLETAGETYGDTQMWLYRGDGSLVAYDDDAGIEKYSLIAVEALLPGTYFVKIQEYGNDGRVPPYTLRVDWTPVNYVADAFEPDNYAAAAKTISNGQTQNRTIHLTGNPDWVKFAIGGDGARNLRILTNGEDGDTQLWLFAANGTQIAYNDNSGPGDFSLIVVPELPSGNYYIKIQENGNNGKIEAYTLRTTWTTMNYVADAFESDDTSATAKAIFNGQTQARSIHEAGDPDWAKFTVGGGGARNLRLETDGTTDDTQMWLYRGNGTLVAYDNNNGNGNFSLIRVALLPPGNYFIKIQEAGNNGAIPAYTLRANWTTLPIPADAFESDNTLTAAKAIANGQTQARSIHAAGNVDWAKFTVGSAGGRNLRLETSGASGDTQLWLYKGSGALLSFDDNDGTGNFSLITLSTLEPGTYFAKIQEHGNNGTISAYTLRASWTTATNPPITPTNTPPNNGFPAEIDGPIKWLHTDVSRWPVTATMSASIEDGKIRFPYSKSNVWPARDIPGTTGNANPWVIVKWTDGKWYAATFEWLRFGQTWKPVSVLDGSKGDHIKKSPLSNWRPSRGERFGLMVSGLARDSRRNVQERSNVVMVTWPY